MSICEKIKNIFVWYHHRKTKFIFAILIGALLVISFVPVRVLLVFGLYKLLKNGLCHKRKTNEVNRMIVSEVLHICIEENGLEEMRQYELQKLRILDKKHNDYITFERKAKDYL